MRTVSVEGFSRQLFKLSRHSRVAADELLDRQVVGLVVGQTQIIGRLVQRFLGFFQVFDGFVKALRGQAPPLRYSARDLQLVSADNWAFKKHRIDKRGVNLGSG